MFVDTVTVGVEAVAAVVTDAFIVAVKSPDVGAFVRFVTVVIVPAVIFVVLASVAFGNVTVPEADAVWPPIRVVSNTPPAAAGAASGSLSNWIVTGTIEIPDVELFPARVPILQSASVAEMPTLYRPGQFVESISVTVVVVSAADVPSFTHRIVKFAPSPVLPALVPESHATN